MKSLSALGLLACAALLGAPGEAVAQHTGVSRTRHLPPVTLVALRGSQASYTTAAPRAEAYSSMFTRSALVNEPTPAATGAGPAISSPATSSPATSTTPMPSPTTPQSEYEQALKDTGWNDADSCTTGGCDTCGTACGCGGGWFGAAGGLVMTRNRANPYWTTYETNNNPNQLMNTQDAGAGWAGGGLVTLGYAFCGCANDCCNTCGPSGLMGPALAFTWWGTGEMNGFSQIFDNTGDPNTALSTPIDLGGVTINGNPASDYFDNASQQAIWRTDNVNSFEFNLLQGGIINTGRLQVIGLAGFRYFRFSEVLTLGSAGFGSTLFDPADAADTAYLGFRCVNNLYGGQIGAIFNYQVSPRFGLFLVPKAGIYGNQMNCQTLLYTGDGVSTYNLYAHKADVSFLGEIDTGVSWAFTPNLRAFVGYRVVGVANVALADNQFLPFLADVAGFEQVKQSGSLILHGGFAGLAWMF